MDIRETSLRTLRKAIQNHEVSFPSQVPVFACQMRADIQWRLVELYFVRNWTCDALARRYGVTRGRAGQIIDSWVRRAATVGYLQEIPVAVAAVPTAVPETRRVHRNRMRRNVQVRVARAMHGG
jgi:hypothetical protein